ncbi:MAG: CoA transferase, partial [Candidatus Eremiobacteraeota bacterium]|nr:CoA transferase [Candidatus Eremiobacteraeota bacterium]MBV8355772.1 CoA transferase [Candidatus Eremiobacteraeota bacterium]
MAERALSGLRVVESATMLAAPLCGMILADHGADVIKVELPGGGDPIRKWGYQKNGTGLAYKLFGRNKRSVSLDLRKPRGKEVFLKLISTADVYIENFRPGTLDKWGLSGEVLRQAKPDLVIMRMSGFGQTGPKSPLPGFGTLAEAMSG